MNLKQTIKKYGVPFLAGTVILGSVAGFTGMAKSMAAPNPPAVQQQAQAQGQQQSPAYKGSIFLGQQDQTNKAQDVKEAKDTKAEAQEDAALVAKAKITKDEAIKKALAAYPGSTIKGAGIGNENGYLVYEIKMTDKAGKALEVKVDAGNGKVLSCDSQTEDNEKENKLEEAHSTVDNDNVQEEVQQ